MEKSQIILTIEEGGIAAKINPAEGKPISSTQLLSAAQGLIKKALEGQEEKAPPILASMAANIVISKSTGDDTEEHN